MATVSADSEYHSKDLETIDNGTVSGGLYSDSYFGYDDRNVNVDYSDSITNGDTSSLTDTTTTQTSADSSTASNFDSTDTQISAEDNNIDVKFDDRNVTYVYKPLDSNAKIKSAHLMVAVYMANMNRNYPVPIELTFNGKTYVNETLSSTYSNSEGPVIINENINRVTSDYLIHFNVTDNVKLTANYVHIDLTKSESANVKMATLLVAYDDDDYDLYYYTINYGHDVVNIDDYTSSTRFQGVYSGSRVYDANLTSYYLASVNAAYKFNGKALENYPPQGGYDGVCSWNVTKRYHIATSNNVLEYERLGSYFKIFASTMLVKYYNSNMLPDLTVDSVYVNPNDYEYNNSVFLDDENEIVVNLENIGARKANKFNITLKLDNISYTKTVSSLDSFEHESVIFNVDYNRNITNVNLSVVIDEENIVSEVSRINNIYNASFNTTYTKFADLNITDIILEDNIVLRNKTRIKVNITNSGLKKSDETIVNIYISDYITRRLIKTANLEKLDINSSQIIDVDWTPNDYGLFVLEVVVNDNNEEISYDNNKLNYTIIVNNPNLLSIFIISDNSGTNSYNQASKTLLEDYAGLIDIQIRTDNQAGVMSNQELTTYLESADIVIADWLSSGVYEKLNAIIRDNPNIIKNKQNKIFLILEPPVSTTASSVEIIKNSTFYIKGVNKLSSLANVGSDVLYDYYFNTTRGLSYSSVYEYIINAHEIPAIYNQATLYKDLSSVDADRNMMLWLLNSMDSKLFNKSYTLPPDRLNTPIYGIYREKWYSSLDDEGNWIDAYDEYAKEHINSSRPTIGIIESKMYVDSQQLQPYYAIISKLESLGLNVLPIVAYGGTNEQLEVMLKTFTNASTLEQLNSGKCTVRIDAMVNMVAYGLGGTDFDKVTPFFANLNIPILKAVHSDYVSNTEYTLGTTGLGALGGDKWWHIAISEAQGAVTPTFVGGYAYTIDENTGASISGYVPHDGNIEVLANSLYNWALLKYLSNEDKKIAILYYNYPPGKQNIAASYMDPVESTLNLLNVLQENGYDVKNIPKNSTILLAQMLSQGTNVANWANGLVEVMVDFRNSSYDEIYGYQYNNTYKIDLENMTEDELTALKDTPGVLLYPVAEFRKWYDKLDDISKLSISEGPVAYIGEYSKIAVSLNYTNFTENIDDWYNGVKELIPSAKINIILPLINNITSLLKSYVQTSNQSYYEEYLQLKEEFLSYEIEGLSGWGEFPGNIMVVEREGIKYFVLPGIQYGNVFITPEPQRGWEGNAEQLYHNTIVPPHYQYLALYAYLQEQQYNAMVFMGRHGTHEWLSGKEVLCADTDFTTIMTGSIPQVYFYITDGLSEGLTAKRRASAVIIDHLTPPMTLTNLYGNLSYIHTLTEEYEVGDKDKRLELAQQMRQIIIDEEYDKDMQINVSALDDDELVAQVNDYINSLTGTLYPYGVHVIGQNWSDEEIGLLVTSMLSSEFEYNEAGDTTSLLNEMAYLLDNKDYASLSNSKKSIAQTMSLNFINALIKQPTSEALNNVTDNPSEGLNKTCQLALKYINTLKESTQNEVQSFLNALNAGYIEPGSGGDPINNPNAIQTGKNFYQDQSSEVPTKSAYEKSKDLLDVTLEHIDNETNKIVLGIWDTETARDDGQLISLVLRLLGMKPTWSSSPSAGADGKKLRETPEYEELEDMYRPEGYNKTRLDVVIVLDGNFRDLYSRQVGLLDKAFRIALARSYDTIVNNQTLIDEYADDLLKAINPIMDNIGYYGVSSESLEENSVASNWIRDFKHYMDLNMTPQQAGEYAISRIFAPPESDYGALISQAVRQSWTFNDTKDLALKYINRMGYIYSSTNWGTYNSKVLEQLLNGTTSLFTSRNTNLYGVIDNDDYFDYWGGLYNAMGFINNKDISFNVIRYGENINTSITEIGQFLKREMNSRYYNPQWIKSMMEQDYAGSSYMSKFASNLYGWASVTDKVTNKDWDNLVSVYIDDKYGLGVDKFLTNGYNSYAMISITGTLLTAAHESKWQTDEDTLRKVADIWAQSVIDNGVACCDCSCGNVFMMDWSLKYINPDLMSRLKAKLYQATQDKRFFEDGYGENDNPNGNVNGTGDVDTNNTNDEGINSTGNATGNTTNNNTGNGTGNATGNMTDVTGNSTGNSTSTTNTTDTDSNTNSTTNTNSTSNSTAAANMTNTTDNNNNMTNASTHNNTITNTTNATNEITNTTSEVTNVTDRNITNTTNSSTPVTNTTIPVVNTTNITSNITNITDMNTTNVTNSTIDVTNTTAPVVNVTNTTVPAINDTNITNEFTNVSDMNVTNVTNSSTNVTNNTSPTSNMTNTTPTNTTPTNTTPANATPTNTTPANVTPTNATPTTPIESNENLTNTTIENVTENTASSDVNNTDITNQSSEVVNETTNQKDDDNTKAPDTNITNNSTAENQSAVENTTVDDTQASSINNTQNSTQENRNDTEEVSPNNNDDENSENTPANVAEESSDTSQQTPPEVQQSNNQENPINEESVKETSSPKVSELTINSQDKKDYEGSTTAATATVGKMHELITSKKGSAITDSAMSALSVIFVLSLLVAIAYGYYNKRNIN